MGHHDTDVLYLIDFGLTYTYLDEQGAHIKKKQLYKFSGNFNFAALNSCRGFNKSRRDDIESAFYVLIYLINNQTLPWSNFDKQFKDTNMDFTDFLRERL